MRAALTPASSISFSRSSLEKLDICRWDGLVGRPRPQIWTCASTISMACSFLLYAAEFLEGTWLAGRIFVRAAYRIRDLANINVTVGIDADTVRPEELPWPFAFIGVAKLTDHLPLHV